GAWMWVRGPVNNFCAVQCERPGILRIRSFVGHHDAETANGCIGNRPKCIQVPAIFFNPPVIDVMGTDRMFHWKQGSDLVLLKNYFSFRIDNETDVEEAVL